MSATRVRRCRECGCTDNLACIHPGADLVCSWTEPDLCSGCAPDAVPGWRHPPRRVPHVPPSLPHLTPDLIGVLAL